MKTKHRWHTKDGYLLLNAQARYSPMKRSITT